MSKEWHVRVVTGDESVAKLSGRAAVSWPGVADEGKIGRITMHST